MSMATRWRRAFSRWISDWISAACSRVGWSRGMGAAAVVVVFVVAEVEVEAAVACVLAMVVSRSLLGWAGAYWPAVGRGLEGVYVSRLRLIEAMTPGRGRSLARMALTAGRIRSPRRPVCWSDCCCCLGWLWLWL